MKKDGQGQGLVKEEEDDGNESEKVVESEGFWINIKEMQERNRVCIGVEFRMSIDTSQKRINGKCSVSCQSVELGESERSHSDEEKLEKSREVLRIHQFICLVTAVKVFM